MKFGKSLTNQIEKTLPQWRDKFLSYKELKKRLKLILPIIDGSHRPLKRRRSDGGGDVGMMTKEEELQDRVVKTKHSNYDEMLNIRKEIVDFHGRLVKILKKYDKRTGALIRLPFIQKVVQQPFFTTDLIYKLVKECERMLDRLFPIDEPSSACVDERCCSASTGTGTGTSDSNVTLRCPKEVAEIEKMESLYMKSSISALRALKEIRSTRFNGQYVFIG